MSTLILHSEDDLGCACAACTGRGPELISDLIDSDTFFVVDPASVDNLAGTTAANGKPIWTPDQIAAYLNRTGGGFADGFNDTAQVGRQNNIGDDNSVITFGFFNTQADVANNGYVYESGGRLFGLAEYFNFAPFTDAQREAAREAMGFWDDVIAVTFREASVDDADMNFGNLASAPQTQAYARIPTAGLDATLGGQVREIGGDSWYSASQASNFQLTPGGYGLNTLTHEIGHAIGLSHPGAYNFGPGFSVTYANGAEYFQDARNYTIMSYWNPRDIGARDFNFGAMALAYGGTPMVHDILAAQRMYGVDTTTRTGDTTYGFNSNAGRDVFDFTINKAPTIAIWDAGGNDTLDASGFATNQIIDLNPGSLSSIGGLTKAAAMALTIEEVNAERALLGYPPIALATFNANKAALAARDDNGARLTDNVGIAYGAWIENAVGGSGDDILIGSAAANVLNGGAGQDTASYVGAREGMTFSASSRTGSGDAVGDRYISIERFEGTNFADTMTGGSANDYLLGAGGDDLITGGNGVDTLFGGAGNDTIDGGNGSDALYGDAGNDLIRGGNDNDSLVGGAGDDRLEGGNGNDRLLGGTGNDVLQGGNGNDTFVFENLSGNDQILDFRRGQDKIDLSQVDAITGGTKDMFAWIGSGAFSGVAGQLRSYSEGGSSFVAGDTNGDGVADFVIQVNTPIVQTDVIFA